MSYSERENFLQNKLSQLNISNVITKVVNTGLETTLIKIEDDIDKEKLRISNVSILKNILTFRTQKNYQSFSLLII